MTTVSAKELRQNLSSYLDRMAAGEEFAVIRRSEIIGRLKPTKTKKKEVGNGPTILAAIKDFHDYVDKNNIRFSLDPNKSIKELYRESMAKKPKYARYVSNKPNKTRKSQ